MSAKLYGTYVSMECDRHASQKEKIRMPKAKRTKRITKAFGDYRIRDLMVSDEELVEIIKDTVAYLLEESRGHMQKAGGKIVEDSIQIIIKKKPGNGDPLTRYKGEGTIGIRYEAEVPVGYCDPGNQTARQ